MHALYALLPAPVDQRCLQDPQAQDGHLLILGAAEGDLAAFAVEDDGVCPVGGLNDVEPFGDLSLQVAPPQIPGEEDRPLCSADFQHRLVRRVGRGAGEPPQNRLGGGGAGSRGVNACKVHLGGIQHINSWVPRGSLEYNIKDVMLYL